MNEYKITVYAICKNELKFVEKWVENMSEADYICVLDTGSTDGTYETFQQIAKKYEEENNPCKIILDQKTYNPWRFDTPRNDSMKLCPEDTDIFVCTDLDELFEPGWSKPLRENWDPNKYDMVSYLYTWSHLENGDAGRVFVYNKIHGHGFMWKFPVHESLCRDPEAYLRAENESIRYLNLNSYIMLHHYPIKKDTRSNYLDLLKLRAEEFPNDTFGLMYLAHEYCYREMYQECIDVFDKLIGGYDYEHYMSSAEKSSCFYFRGDAYSELSNHAQALEDYKTAIDLDPTLREPYLKVASLLIKMHIYSGAIDYAKEAIRKGHRHYSWLEKDTSWSYEPYDTLCIASFYSGHKRDALAYAYKAYTFDPKNVRLKNNIEVILKNMSDEEIIS